MIAITLDFIFPSNLAYIGWKFQFAMLQSFTNLHHYKQEHTR